jgi:hypothetical protein
MAPPKLQPALLGGLFAGVLSALPFVNMANCCCLWLIAGGVMAAYLMQLNHPGPISMGQGALVGFLAGIFGALITLLLDIPLRAFVMPLLPEMGTFRTRRTDLPPEVRQALRAIGPSAMAIAGGIIFMTISLLFQHARRPVRRPGVPQVRTAGGAATTVPSSCHPAGRSPGRVVVVSGSGSEPEPDVIEASCQNR